MIAIVLRTCVILFLLISCHPPAPQSDEFFSSDLFADVQRAEVFPDSKTLADCRPKRPLAEILRAYAQEKPVDREGLRAFVEAYFDLPQRPSVAFSSDNAFSTEAHIQSLWPVLTRPADVSEKGSSRLPLPFPYVVPGGRFSEVYYWDSYFTLLGLRIQGHQDLAQSIVDNFAYLIDTLGFIPNGNRTYYLSRSQPPVFALMVSALAENDVQQLIRYLPQMVREHGFWMEGSDKATKPGQVFRRVVVMSDGTQLNRYWDERSTPRPEAFREDEATRAKANSDSVYRELRAAAESGWDFSSRWLADGESLASIRTTAIVPVDLNALLVHLEMTISRAYRALGDSENERRYKNWAASRRRAINTFMWHPELQFFVDYDFAQRAPCVQKTLAGMFPFFIGFSQADMAEKAAATLAREFLMPGGLVTSLRTTGQQWDAPNGWAPLQWVAYRGLRQYKQDDLAFEVRKRWLRQIDRVYRTTGKLMEKYNVADTTLLAGGGEYPNQDGFGWTNGVYLALQADH